MKKRISIIAGILCCCAIIIAVWNTRDNNNTDTIAEQKKVTDTQKIQPTPTKETTQESTNQTAVLSELEQLRKDYPLASEGSGDMNLIPVSTAINKYEDIIEVTVTALKDPYQNDVATFNQYELKVDKVLKGNNSGLKQNNIINLQVMENIDVPVNTIKKGNKFLLGVYESEGSYLFHPCLAFYITNNNKIMNLSPCTEEIYNNTDLNDFEKMIKE